MAKNYDLPESEYYPTPDWCVKALFDLICFDDLKGEGWTFAEPCKGEASAIYKYFPEGSEYNELSEGKDYLKSSWNKNPDCIITNPPFSIAKEFLGKSLTEAPVVAYLLKTSFLESVSRFEFNNKNKPDHMLVLSRRPSFVGGTTGKYAYSWLIYDKQNKLGLKDSFYFNLGER